MHPKTCLAIALLLPVASSFGQGPRAEEVRELRRKIDANLVEELTRRWYPRALELDGKGTGFHQTFARDWSPLPDDNRSLVYQSRMTWTAAAFARYSTAHHDEFAGYARRGVEYLDKVMRDGPSGGFHWALGKDGKVSTSLGTEKHVYGTAFALYAASAVYEVTHDETAQRVARDAFDWLEQHAHDPDQGGYFEALNREGQPILAWDAKAPLSRRTDRLGIYYGFKTMNSHIHLLEAIAEYYKVEKTPLVKRRLEETLAIVRDKIAAEPGGLNLYLSLDWHAAPAHDSFGHDIETSYLLLEAAEVLGIPDDPKTVHMARRLIDHALDWGWDDQHGGFYDKGDVFNGRAYDTTKVWWTQAEGLNALLLMHLKHGRETDRYWKAFRKQWAFIEAHMLDPVHGGWFMDTARDGSLTGDTRKATQWKACYHTGRALMNVAAMLDQIEKAAPKD
jgi:mannobiose 2-epimerase